MKTVLVLLALVAVVLCRPEETYSTKYDELDPNEITGNERVIKNYCNCFLGKGPCTPEGTDFKKIIPDAVKTNCGKCNAKQRKLIRTVMKAMRDKVPDLWEELVKKEDPHNKYRPDIENFMNGTD